MDKSFHFNSEAGQTSNSNKALLRFQEFFLSLQKSSGRCCRFVLCLLTKEGWREWEGLRAVSRQMIGCARRQSGPRRALIGWHGAKLQVSCALREAGLGEGDQSPSVYISNHLLHRRASASLKRIYLGFFFFPSICIFIYIISESRSKHKQLCDLTF